MPIVMFLFFPKIEIHHELHILLSLKNKTWMQCPSFIKIFWLCLFKPTITLFPLQILGLHIYSGDLKVFENLKDEMVRVRICS